MNSNSYTPTIGGTGTITIAGGTAWTHNTITTNTTGPYTITLPHRIHPPSWNQFAIHGGIFLHASVADRAGISSNTAKNVSHPYLMILLRMNVIGLCKEHEATVLYPNTKDETGLLTR